MPDELSNVLGWKTAPGHLGGVGVAQAVEGNSKDLATLCQSLEGLAEVGSPADVLDPFGRLGPNEGTLAVLAEFRELHRQPGVNRNLRLRFSPTAM